MLHLQDVQLINDEHIDNAENLDIIMPMQNIVNEYSDNYSETSGSLWQSIRDEFPVADTGNPDVSTDNSPNRNHLF